MQTPLHKTVGQLVDEHHEYARVLHYFGIPFYQCDEASLAGACTRYGVSMCRVIHELESVNRRQRHQSPSWTGIPVELIVEYLKHTHSVFVKERLPYVGQLVAHLPEASGENGALAKDLKFVFPLFAEDFIHHIHEEEDELFSYLLQLSRFRKGDALSGTLYYQMEQHNLQAFALEHSMEDDEMAGIRSITHDYEEFPTISRHLRVIYRELRAFEAELITHARVENEILFPKALALEHQVRQQLTKTIGLN